MPVGKTYKCECDKCNFKYEMYEGMGFNGMFIPYFCKQCFGVFCHFIDCTKGTIPDFVIPKKCEKCSSNEVIELVVGENHSCPKCNSKEAKQVYSGEFD